MFQTVIAIYLCSICALRAARKGYNPVLWFLAGGPVAYLLLLCLPAANKLDQSPEQRRRALWIGNGVATVLAGIVIAAIGYACWYAQSAA